MTLRPSTWLVAAAFTLVTSAASAEPPTPPHRPPLRLILTPPRVSQSASHRAASSGWPASDPDPWWGPDKALHFSLAALLAGGGYALGAIVTDDPVGRAALGADLALSAALFKEAADEAGLGTPSWRDFTWSVLGTALGISVSVAIDLAAPKSTPSPAR